jgi:ribosomal protein S18 acetylase RimI-like enzyme
MPLTVRQATPDDLGVVVEFNCRLAEETEGKTLNRDILTPGVMSALQDPRTKGPYFLAIDDGETVGQLGVTFEWSDWRNGWYWWIQSVYVRVDARRRGIFRTLYQHVHSAALADPQVIGLRLYVERENHRAQETYRNLGMTPSGYLLFERYPL